MCDLLKQIERQYGSVIEYNRSMDEDAVYEKYEREQFEKTQAMIVKAETMICDFLVASGYCIKPENESIQCRDCEKRSAVLRVHQAEINMFACYDKGCAFNCSNTPKISEQFDDKELPF